MNMLCMYSVTTCVVFYEHGTQIFSVPCDGPILCPSSPTKYLKDYVFTINYRSEKVKGRWKFPGSSVSNSKQVIN
jgi:hypothetical protein